MLLSQNSTLSRNPFQPHFNLYKKCSCSKVSSGISNSVGMSKKEVRAICYSRGKVKENQRGMSSLNDFVLIFHRMTLYSIKD